MSTLLTVADLAARWKCSEATVKRRIREGLPTCGVVRGRFRLEDVESFEHSKTAATLPANGEYQPQFLRPASPKGRQSVAGRPK